MKTDGEAQFFRDALKKNNDLRELAIQPLATEFQILTACIWQFLMVRVFSFEGSRNFYSAKGQNAGYYIKNIAEIEYLMTYENETGSGRMLHETDHKEESGLLISHR
jgi:hypothetical protein